ncbi:hypothetical protein F1559_002086 [Cyanidiococcus yangmingshanensis]|uniref:peptidylprolyl isomerase n=1 Tax=Cyanidiococcus yangmingshanensis TaxID=2690220 RepID=A0A7J7IJI0_9RHOD|nr:hypothetical protein F1559_002086 [Cyanidiococcus yangmingshanensis]
MLTLQVRCFNGKKISVVPHQGVHTSVSEIQNEVEKGAGIPTSNQLLMFRGQVLDDPQQTLAGYGIDETQTELTMSVVRNVRSGSGSDGGLTTNRITKSAGGSAAEQRASRVSSSAGAQASGAGSRAGLADVEALARQLRGLSAGSGGRGGRAGGANPATGDPTALLQSLLAGNRSGVGGSGGDDQTDAMNWLQQMTQMMGGLWDSPAMQDYLSSEEKQEESRQALLNNPFLRQWMDADPQFREVVEDPRKWAESMRAAKELFAQQGLVHATGESSAQSQGVSRLTAAGTSTTSNSRKDADRSTSASKNFLTAMDDDDDDDDAEAENPAKTSARLRDERTRELAQDQGLNLDELSLGYGFALGQALLNSGFGLDHELVIQGFRDALAGKEFPVNIAKYERQMGVLQGIANDVVGELNLQEAEAFFETAKNMPELFSVLEPDRLVWEEVDDAENADKAEAGKELRKKCQDEQVNVMMVLQGRLLDGRFFFTCPSDENGEMVNPITMRVGDAPPALKKVILDMHEGEARTVYIHPERCEGMSDMFGQMLPKNALLIFDIELVQVNVSMEEGEE